MTNLDHQIKMVKAAYLSEEPLEELNSSTRFSYYMRKSTIDVEPENLLFQRVKRRNARRWKYNAQKIMEGSKGVSKLLGQAIGFDKSIQKLFISFKRDFPDQDLRYLAHGLKSPKSVQRMAFEFHAWCMTNERLSSIMRGLQKLRSLKSFSLNLYYLRISDIGLNYVRKTIKKMIGLKKIHIFFYHLPQVTDKGVFTVSGSFNRLIKLEYAALIINECSQITDRSLANIRLKKLISLKKIYLDFGWDRQLTDKSFYFLTQSLKNLPNLQSLKLRFPICHPLSDLSLHYIWETMDSLPSLRRVTLEFGQANITDAALVDMKRTLKCLALLEKFSIEIFDCPEMSNDGVATLCKALEKAVSLQKLCVYFGGQTKITDRSVKKVIDCMKKFPHLRKAGVDFSHSERITGASLNFIRQFIESQTSLEKIEIGVNEMEGTSVKAMERFLKWLDNLERQRPGLKLKYKI